MRKVMIIWAEDDDKFYDTYSQILRKYLALKDLEAAIHRATDGNMLVRLLQSLGSNADLLLVDIEMKTSSFDGLDTADHCHEHWPDLPVIIISGYIRGLKYTERLEAMKRTAVIKGYFDKEDKDDWCEAIWHALDFSPPTILHVSDIHFGKYDLFAQKKLDIKGITKNALDLIKQETRVNLIIVSGDLTSEGDEDEFVSASGYLNYLSDQLGVDRDHIIVVPGNHDIYRKEKVGKRFRNFLNFIWEYYQDLPDPERVLTNYFRLQERPIKKLLKKHISAQDLFRVDIFDELKTMVIGWNSAVEEEGRFHLGEIGMEQLVAVQNTISDLRQPRDKYFRIGVLHHNFILVPNWKTDETSDNLIQNHSLVLNHFVDLKVGMVLHGHTHYSSGYMYMPYDLGITGRPLVPIHVFSTGALSSIESTEPQSFFNLNLIKCNSNDKNEISSAKVTSYRLPFDRLVFQSSTVEVSL